jgi:hypothetical protein
MKKRGWPLFLVVQTLGLVERKAPRLTPAGPCGMATRGFWLWLTSALPFAVSTTASSNRTHRDTACDS